VVRSTLRTKRPKLGEVENQNPRETESFRPSGWHDRRIGCAEKPCADKQRITGRTALPVPTTIGGSSGPMYPMPQYADGLHSAATGEVYPQPQPQNW
jgi:hypothetical protein